jgi:serine/threonine-protein kinase
VSSKADALTQPRPASPTSYAVGNLIADKYRLDRVLGEGGQACVWQARNLMLNVDVAIKVVRADARDPAHTRRLLQEARAAAGLDHPAIVRIFDLGETASGDLFLVMELLEGQGLSDHIYERERLPPIEAVRVLLPVADALAVAHQKGLVHRDIKPENVFLARANEGAVKPKLLDFGVVKLQKGELASEQLTESGAVVGTPAYFAPEQARGSQDVDERTDVWAFCAMLYECVTGALPFTGPNYNALLRSILEEHPRAMSEFGIDEPALWRIVQRGLAKPSQQRWPSMRALGRALSAWLLERGVVDDISGASLQSRWSVPDGVPPTLAAPGQSTPGTAVSTDEAERNNHTLPSSAAPVAWLTRRSSWIALALGALGAAGWLAWPLLDSEDGPPPKRDAALPAEALGPLAPPVTAPTSPPVDIRVQPVAPAAAQSTPTKTGPYSPVAPAAPVTRLRKAKPAAPVASASARPSPAPEKDDLGLLTPYEGTRLP